MLAVGTFCVTNHKDILEKILPNELVLVNTPKEMKEMVEHYLRYPEEKPSFITKAYINVVNNHTYFNRVREIFDYLDIDDTNIDKTFETVKKQLYIEGVE